MSNRAHDRRRPLGKTLWGTAALGLFLSQVACEGLRPTANPELPVWKNRAGWVMEVEYTRDLLAASRKEGELYERGEPEIDPRGKRVFVGSSDGGLYCLDAVDGKTIWRFETLSFVQSAPYYDRRQDVLYFGSHDGAMYKVRALDGKLLWRLNTRAEVARRPALSGGMVYFTNANDTLVAANSRTGEIRWAQHRTPAMGMEIAGHSGAVVHDGLVYMGFSDGTATAFDAITGDERWQPVDLAAEAEEATGDIPKYLDVDTTPEIIRSKTGDLAVFGSYVGGVYALDARVGTLIWSNSQVHGTSDLALWEQPAYTRNGVQRPKRSLLLVSSGTTGLWAIDPVDGTKVWQRRLPAGGVSRPVPVAGAIIMNATQLGTYLLSPIDGSLIDGLHFDAGVSGTPAAFGDRAYTMTNGGTFLALHIQVPSAEIEAPASVHSALEGF